MQPAAIVVGPRPVEVLGLLLVTCITSAFGNSLQSISLISWIQPFILLLTYEGSVRTLRSSLVAHVSVIAAQALGFTFAFAGALSYPSTTLASLLSTFGLGATVATATTLGALLPAAHLRLLAAELLPPPPVLRFGRSASYQPPSLTPLGWLLMALPVWAFPIFQSAVFTLLGFQLGHFHEPGVAVADWPAVAQLASLFGLWGINFLLSLAAAAATCVVTSEPLPLTAAAEPLGSFSETVGTAGSGGSSSGWSRLSRPLRRQVLAVALGLWLLVVVGGGLVYSDAFYQQPVVQRLGRQRQLPVSCLTAQSVEVGTEEYVWLWNLTGERVAAGDRFVLWSEEAVRVRAGAEEGALLDAGRDLLMAHGSADPDGGTYLGICYQKVLLLEEEGVEGAGSSKSASRLGGIGGAGTSSPKRRVTNHFVLLGPNGTTVWNYRKAFPVPIVEAGVMAGPRQLPVADSPYGTLGGAICFDMDRPQYVRQAGAAGVDLFLQPSWTWGAVGPRHFASNALRALENGFTTFRCSSDGVSGVVSPRGFSQHYLLAGAHDALTFALPLQRRVRTLYVAAGWVLEWVNLGTAAALLALLLLVPRRLLARWAQWCDRDGGEGPQGAQEQQQEPLLRHV